MKIACPKCNASGTIPDHEIPESGRFFSCPRCNEGFTVIKPRSGTDMYLVGTCPSCSFSAFDDETFSTCPKCGIAVKSFVERRREEQRLKQNDELLGKKLNNSSAASPPTEATASSVADFIDNLHPVNLISFGVAAAAVIVLCFGLWGIISYDASKIQAVLIEDRDEQVSGLYVFLYYGLMHWVKLVYGVSGLTVAILFMKRLKAGLKAMSILLWVTIVLVPLVYSISFVNWVLAPIPHTIGGYMIETLNILLTSTLVGVPLYFLEGYLHERKITSVVKL